ncbi:MAG: DUF5721 family protein [Lachnospirales bacterium]
MIVFKVLDEDVKSFMNEIYRGEAFSKMPVRYFEVDTYIKYKIDGYLDKNYIESDEDFILWEEVLPFALSALKLKNLKPKSVKLEFCMSNDLVKINDEVKSFLLYMQYDNEGVQLQSNVVLKEFSLNKHYIDEWNEFLLKFFKKYSIPIVTEEI